MANSSAALVVSTMMILKEGGSIVISQPKLLLNPIVPVRFQSGFAAVFEFLENL